MRKLAVGVSLFVLAGCGAIYDWADGVGQHMPVVADERCEHWQCLTESGKAKSEKNKKAREKGNVPDAAETDDKPDAEDADKDESSDTKAPAKSEAVKEPAATPAAPKSDSKAATP
jgi:sRNA-binding protein